MKSLTLIIQTLFIILFLTSNLTAQIYVKYDASGTNDGTSWENAFTDLQTAIDAADAGDQIWVAMGTYKPSGPTPDSSHFMITEAIELYGGFEGTEDQLDQRDPLVNRTVFSGDLNADDIEGEFFINRLDNAFHVVFVDTESGTTVIDGFTVSGGTTRTANFDSDEATKYRGGGMYVRSNGLVMLRQCTFSDNLGYQGGSLYARSDAADGNAISVEHCVFENNYGTSQGTAVLSYMDSALVNNCIFRGNTAESFGGSLVVGNINADISNTSFSSNSSAIGGAVGLYNNSNRGLDSSLITFHACVFDNNSATTRGGAIGINNFFSGSTFFIDSCHFTDNSTTNTPSYGGALCAVSFNQDHSSSLKLIVDRSEFINNSSQRGGGVGAISLADTIVVSVTNSSFLLNETVLGGAGYFESRDWMQVHLNSLHVEENRATSSGGGFDFSNEHPSNSFPVSLEDCMFLNNTGEQFYGGAVLARDVKPVTIKRCEFIGNESERGGSAISLSNTESTIEHCLIQENVIAGTDTFSGGALDGYAGNNSVINTYFTNNQSNVEGAAVGNVQGGNMLLEGVVLDNNTGESTIINRSSKLNLTNVSMVDNDFGIKQDAMSHLRLQNTILANEGQNLLSGGQNPDSIVSRGANISDDASLANYLTGQAGYPDLNETVPLLDEMLVPLPGSPAVDKGNPEDISLTVDANGEPRFMGAQIDIGALESPFTSSSTGIEWDSDRLTVFPNPVSERIQIELTDVEAGAVRVKLFGSSGQAVFSDMIRHSGTVLKYEQKLSHLPAGPYYLVLSTNEGHYGTSITVIQ